MFFRCPSRYSSKAITDGIGHLRDRQSRPSAVCASLRQSASVQPENCRSSSCSALCRHAQFALLEVSCGRTGKRQQPPSNAQDLWISPGRRAEGVPSRLIL